MSSRPDRCQRIAANETTIAIPHQQIGADPALGGETAALGKVDAVLACALEQRAQLVLLCAARIGRRQPDTGPQVAVPRLVELVQSGRGQLGVGAADEPQRPADALVDGPVGVVAPRAGRPAEPLVLVLLVDVLLGDEVRLVEAVAGATKRGFGNETASPSMA